MEITMKEYYVKLIKETFAKFRPLIVDAPIASQRDVMMRRDAAIKDIINEALCMGVDVGIALKEDKPYVSPFEDKGE